MPIPSCQRKSSRPPYTNLGSGAGVGVASGAVFPSPNAEAGASVQGTPADIVKVSQAPSTVVLAAGPAEKFAATFRSVPLGSGTTTCARATHAVPSINSTTTSCFFMIFPSEGRPHAWNQPTSYGKQHSVLCLRSFAGLLQRKTGQRGLPTHDQWLTLSLRRPFSDRASGNRRSCLANLPAAD